MAIESRLSTPEEIRKRLAHETPVQWVPLLQVAESMLSEYGFDTLAEFITTPYQKGGLGITLQKAKEFIEFNPNYKHQANELKQKLGLVELAKSVEVLGEVGGDRKSEDYQVDKIENINLKGGTSAKYRIAKLKRDHPDIAQRLMNGEFKSVSQAEREAGIARPLFTKVQKVINAYNKLSGDEKDEFINFLNLN